MNELEETINKILDDESSKKEDFSKFKYNNEAFNLLKIFKDDMDNNTRLNKKSKENYLHFMEHYLYDIVIGKLGHSPFECINDFDEFQSFYYIRMSPKEEVSIAGIKRNAKIILLFVKLLFQSNFFKEVDLIRINVIIRTTMDEWIQKYYDFYGKEPKDAEK